MKRLNPWRKDALEQDGLGQSLWTDLVWVWRFRACQRRRVQWRLPSEADQATWDDQRELARFGDALIAAATVESRHWFVQERFWHGWPDPPEFVFFAIVPGGKIWCAADFSTWPVAWGTKPIAGSQT